ncbi:autotransporter outer membrane beta-barrel domain-containing protein [Roseomonas sp. 18066]|uniref:autotransporter outer membrane beta-barrel domain-containing protein n=1 Tax=Roseomonas sp. 18066 TaxID=2681412 RepID=UPI00135A2A24|nr:autotransporter outer membrane beta-barrel domain-containing protein [Roseomonas sp. 18066]
MATAPGRNLGIMLGACAAGQFLLPNAGQAQTPCNASGNPAPPAPIQADYANQTFGTTAPQTPYGVVSRGLAGCPGIDGGDGGHPPGSPGQAGAQITGTNTNLLVIGGGNPDAGLQTFGAPISSIGGAGGQGGVRASETGEATGGQGGAGGVVTIGFDGRFVADPASGPAGIGLDLVSRGGAGGRGGDSGTAGIFYKQASAGGGGGDGGSASLVASGTVLALTAGVRVQSFGGGGGDGGIGATADLFDTTQGGDGGRGGAAGGTTLRWTGGTIQTGGQGLVAVADGGAGGAGGDAYYSFITTTGGRGGDGGAGGTAGVTLGGGSIAVTLAPGTAAGSGISVQANGGQGGAGGVPAVFSIATSGGNGGNGGGGGIAGATILGSVGFTGSDVDGVVSGQGVLVQANGGGGGLGANAEAVEGQAGSGGRAGIGGSASLTLGAARTTGIIRTAGNYAHGALVQSVGGGGGAGGQARFNADGGAGAAGGNGGPVAIDAPNGLVIVTGRNAIGLLAQSIGGGGGSGGDTNDIAIGAQFAIGGNGGVGGDGNSLRVNLGAGIVASTSTLGGGGVLAQSIGGAGGAGGSATSKGIGLISMTVGGDAGGGGRAGPLSLVNGGLVTTYGDHAAGIQAQSIGGGGGKGGSALSFNGGIVPVASVAVGGGGGGGGPGNRAFVTNGGQITTYGPNAAGVLIQSIGGGGGTGGAAAARSVDISPTQEIPAISVDFATGGQGGAGNTGGAAGLTNTGLITTAGDAAMGVIVQSIGGGGGAGGDSTAASYGSGGQGGVSISISVAVGGRGGTGGTGGAVTVINQGLVATRGQDAYGVIAQSIGGGGGAGGGGDASASASDAKFSFATAVGVGGRGGTGGDAGTVDLRNSGAILTRGDGADAVFAQSVGGGGGAAGGGTATYAGGNLSIAVGVGGQGGAGGQGNAATVVNSGSILTRGTDAIGLAVQSIGGGGGKAGKGGATAGGVTDLSNAQALYDTLAAGLNFNQAVTRIADGILQIGQIGENIQATAKELNGIFDQPQSGKDEEGSSVSIQVSVSVGGTGGAAGPGGLVSATNTGQISTLGAQSDGIYAQSIGGGGGSGGGASSTSAASDDTPVQSAIGVGGNAGGGGNGGGVNVVNGAGGSIVTQGVAAFGIFAQSVGGGGGEAALAGTVSGSLRSLSVGIGGSGGVGGDGGAVSVTTEGGSSLVTGGKHGIGILAQSIGGGGGLVRTMTTDQTFDPAKIADNPQGRIGDVHGLVLDFGGRNGIAGQGGTVLVTTNAPLTTSGLNAHGILAQSVGGGGGLLVGGRATIPPGGTGGSGGAQGDGGNVTIRLQAGTVLRTSGDGAFGVLAQSIGGGGGAAGDFSAVNRYQLRTSDAVKASTGNGGAVSVSLGQAQVTTTGSFAPALFAQSIGGGGGLMNISTTDATVTNVQARGTAGGSGAGGAVTIALTGSQVGAYGLGSAGILAQSDGSSAGPISISLDPASTVLGGLPSSPTGQAPGEQDAAAVRLLGGTGNRIDNAGTIGRSDSHGFAILTNSPASNTTIANSGRILGDVMMNDGAGSSLENRPGGLLSAPSMIYLGGGTLRNDGALHVGGIGRAGQTVLTGQLLQGASGRLVIETNHSGGATDELLVRGRASLSGTVEVHPLVLANRAVPMLSATEGLTTEAGFNIARTHLLRFEAVPGNNSLQILPIAEFQTAAASLGTNQQRVAAHLQELWDSGASMDAAFTALAGTPDNAAYNRTLNSISGQTIGAIAASRYSSSHGFVANMLNECGTYGATGSAQPEDHCVWGRAFGSYADQDGTGGSLGYQARSWTFQTGAQRRVAQDWFVGASVAYENSQFRGDEGSSKVSGENLLLGASLRFQRGPWQLSGGLDAGYGWYDSQRLVSVGTFGSTAKASPNAWHVGAHSRLAYQMPFDGWYLQPRLDLHLTYVRSGGYTESGASPFNLAVQSEGSTLFSAVPAIELGARIRLGTAITLRPYASAGIAAMAHDDWAATARFADQPSGRGFRATTPIPDVLAKVTLGADLLSGANWDFGVQYRLEAGDGFVSHAGVGQMAYRF